MAYPTSAITFTTKNAGDAIQGEHVNTLQTEVAALEAAMLTGGLAHNLLPATDSTWALGSTSKKWIIDGSQITPGTIPSTSLSTTGTPGAATFLSGAGWAAAGGVVTILKSTSGQSSAAGDHNLSTCTITGLTAMDRLRVHITEVMTGTAGSTVGSLYHETDSVALQTLNAAGALSSVAHVYDVYDLCCVPSSVKKILSLGTTVDMTSTGLNNSAPRGFRQTATTDWTGAWSLALRSGGVAAGGTLSWSWTVYKLAGQ